jgi:hypothetical protein
MRALSIRQPYVEEILRGIKTIEYRPKACRKDIGKRFYIYAAKQPAEGRGVRQRFAKLGAEPGDLPAGVIVGTAVITHCTRRGDTYRWHLADVRRLKRHRKPRNKPQPSWFNPF